VLADGKPQPRQFSLPFFLRGLRALRGELRLDPRREFDAEAQRDAPERESKPYENFTTKDAKNTKKRIYLTIAT
jgi:hypothetical protein